MGKIFGICDNPVSTIDKAIRLGGQFEVPVPVYKVLPQGNKYARESTFVKGDEFTSSVQKPKNGWEKLKARFNRHKVAESVKNYNVDNQ